MLFHDWRSPLHRYVYIDWSRKIEKCRFGVVRWLGRREGAFATGPEKTKEADEEKKKKEEKKKEEEAKKKKKKGGSADTTITRVETCVVSHMLRSRLHLLL